MALAEIPDWAITTFIGIVGFIALWLNRQRLGLGVVQMATRAEQQKVIELQEKRINLLEADVERLRGEVHFLSAELAEYRRRNARLTERVDD